MKLYGYTLFGNLEYRINTHQLINVKNGKVKKISDTKARFLEFILSNSNGGYLHDEDIIFHVWEKYEMSGSKSQLSNTIKSLNMDFLNVGFNKKLVTWYTKQTYFIDLNEVKRCYVEV